MAHLLPEGLRFVLSNRALSDDVALDNVLADIPFLSVGILAFCTFTFLALVKRLGIMFTTLHLSIISAFVASVLDLSQILQRGTVNTDLGLGLDSVQSLIKTREVGYALSNSLRFLFFWIFVAEPPKTERDTPGARAGSHCGKWNAWGFIGLILQYSTLGLTLAVFALQVVWRIDGKLAGFSTLYAAEAAIEVILSAVFILKLMLNCAHSRVVSKWICLFDYLGFIVSLIFSTGFGVANLMELKFTETILGRFLQGVNFYILVLCSLLMVFMPLMGPRSDRLPIFRPLSPKQSPSSFGLSQPDVPTPNPSAVPPLPDSSMAPQPRVKRASSAAKLSEWLATQRVRLSSLSLRGGSQDGMNAQLWNQNRAERGQSFQEDSSMKDSEIFEKVYGYPDTYLGPEPLRLQSPPVGKPKLEAPRLGRGRIQSMTSRYSDLDLSPPDSVDRRQLQADSPVFGLDGIVRPSTVQSKTDSVLDSQDSATVADPDRKSDFSGLFRKQEELDSSIAALKLFGDSTNPPSTPSSKQSWEPSTARSDFSLSNFPRPPWVGTSELDVLSEPPPSPDSVRTVRLHPTAPMISVDNVPFDLIPPRFPASMTEHNRTLSVPVSESAESDLLVSARTPRFDSHGTQYDVTSFIGNLTGPPPPGHKKEFSTSSNVTGGMTVASSGSDDPEQIATIVTLQQSKQAYVGSPLARMPIVSPTSPRMLPATRVMLPSKPKLDISQPRPARLRQDVSSNTFERPRPVPSMN